MSRLVPCPACLRHVRASEPECPFCEHAFVGRAGVPNGDAPFGESTVPRSVGVHGLKRAALFALGASVATTLGCGATPAKPAPDLTPAYDVTPAYGGPPANEPPPEQAIPQPEPEEAVEEEPSTPRGAGGSPNREDEPPVAPAPQRVP